MSKVIKSEVENINGKILIELKNLEKSLTSLSNAIEAFQTESQNDLKGNVWNKVREKLNYDNIIIKETINVSIKLAEGINLANVGMIRFMNNDSELDDSKLSSLKNEVQRQEAYRYEIMAKLYTKSTNSENNDSNVATIVWDKDSLRNEYSSLSKSIQLLYKSIKKLEELKPTDTSLYTSLYTLIADENNLSKKIDSLPISSVNLVK